MYLLIFLISGLFSVFVCEKYHDLYCEDFWGILPQIYYEENQ
jgi:hypothetical protein